MTQFYEARRLSDGLRIIAKNMRDQGLGSSRPAALDEAADMVLALDERCESADALLRHALDQQLPIALRVEVLRHLAEGPSQPIADRDYGHGALASPHWQPAFGPCLCQHCSMLRARLAVMEARR